MRTKQVASIKEGSASVPLAKPSDPDVPLVKSVVAFLAVL
jgi:hypothetical protein